MLNIIHREEKIKPLCFMKQKLIHDILSLVILLIIKSSSVERELKIAANRLDAEIRIKL